MTITKKRTQPGFGNHIRAKTSLDSSAGLEKRLRWTTIAKKPRKF
jgi:hypothetical protein